MCYRLVERYSLPVKPATQFKKGLCLWDICVPSIVLEQSPNTQGEPDGSQRHGRRRPTNSGVDSRNQVRGDVLHEKIQRFFAHGGAVVDTVSGKNAEAKKVNQAVSAGVPTRLQIQALFDSDNHSCNETDPDDAAKSSTWSECEASSGSATTAPDIDIASAELVSLLVEHVSLKNLYPAAITTHGQHEFRQSMYIVLRSYGKALKAEAKQPQEIQSGDLVRGLAQHVAHAIVAFHDPSNPPTDIESRWEALRRQKTGALSMLEDFLDCEKGQGNELEKNWELLSDVSDIEDIDQPLRSLDKVKAYMTSGPAFEQLCKDVLHLTVQDSKYEGPRFIRVKKDEVPCKQILEPSKFRDVEPKGDIPVLILQSYNAHKSWLKAKYWPKLSPQCTRLHWKCDCGVMLYEDYATMDPATIVKLSLLINKPSSLTTGSAKNRESPIIQPSNAYGISIETRAADTPNLSSPSNDGEAQACQACSGMRPCKICAKGLSKKFLALCVNTGRFHATLGEIDVTNICRDNETFRIIKDRYLEVRGFRARPRRLFLFQPHSVHFLKVNVEDTFRADIVEKPSIPPREEVLAKRYEYSPLDLPLPPITSNSFLHYLQNPDCESLTRTRRWLSYLPKRLEEQLVSRRRCSEPDVIVTGWGIHIEEGLNEEALACIALITLLCSGLAGLTYSVKTGDVSGGFTVGAYIATVLGVGISVLCYRWRQE